MSNSKEPSAGITLKPMLSAGQRMMLDADMQNKCLVKVVQQTEGKLFTEIEYEDGYRWWVMSYRLTLPCT